MDNNQIIKYDNGQLIKVSNAIAVTNKLLAIAEPQLIPYRKKDKWGFCTPEKKIVIDCVYDDAYQFFEGLARVKLNGKFGFINKQGVQIIPFEYENADDFSGKCSFVEFNKKSGSIDKDNFYTEFETRRSRASSKDVSFIFFKILLKIGDEPLSVSIPEKDYELKSYSIEELELFLGENKALIELMYNKYEDVKSFINGLAKVKINGEWVYIDKKGTEYWED